MFTSSIYHSSYIINHLNANNTNSRYQNAGFKSSKWIFKLYICIFSSTNVIILFVLVSNIAITPLNNMLCNTILSVSFQFICVRLEQLFLGENISWGTSGASTKIS